MTGMTGYLIIGVTRARDVHNQEDLSYLSQRWIPHQPDIGNRGIVCRLMVPWRGTVVPPMNSE